jgi:hypothetical protein
MDLGHEGKKLGPDGSGHHIDLDPGKSERTDGGDRVNGISEESKVDEENLFPS